MVTQRADPETVLRLAGEQALLACSGPRRGSVDNGSLTKVASALCVLAGLPFERAQDVVDDYSRALSMRGQGMPLDMIIRRQLHAQAGAPAPLTAPTIRYAGTTVQVGPDAVHVLSVVFHDDRTEVLVSYARPPAFHQSRRRPRPVPALPPAPRSLTITDDRGTSGTAGFSGGGSDGQWSGSWTTHQVLSPETAWIELDGARVELAAAAAYAEVRVEERPLGDLVAHYLWHQLASEDHHHRPGPDPVVDVLWSLGLLSESDSELLAAYAEALQSLEQPNPRSAPSHPALPPEWRGYLAGRTAPRRPAPRHLEVPLAALTPEFDGITLLVHNLRGTAESFTVDVHVRGPAGLMGPRSFFDHEVPRGVLVWWAEDDRGGCYLGRWGASSSGPHSIDGEITFAPGVDPEARALRLLPSTLRHRAVIEVPLP